MEDKIYTIIDARPVDQGYCQTIHGAKVFLGTMGYPTSADCDGTIYPKGIVDEVNMTITIN